MHLSSAICNVRENHKCFFVRNVISVFGTSGRKLSPNVIIMIIDYILKLLTFVETTNNKILRGSLIKHYKNTKKNREKITLE